ncbi:alpha/beta fold hydrolase [Massilia norwichensis]|uniref:Alpha/beta hydrolase n=1 Tax=Massilia norwichensis TaxID=1442366 RepID=A0ABT2A2P0_9BURK|nr:alpha/beta hydrolase [Massilia norwichensis]MCS0588355.1 alpha/beta hydrolase [Massilia norwichensis]
MNKPLLHFTHGNSYPSGAYGRLLEELGRDFDVRTTDMLGHDPRYPVDDNWHALIDELIAQLERYDQPAILVGHSLGGAVGMLAAARRPDLARCVVMLDSPVVAGWRAAVWRLAKALGLGRKLSPGGVAQRRRNVWPSRQAAYEHFIAKPIFQAWAPGALDDYLDHGLKPHPQGVQLRFDREVEASIYASLPHDMGPVLKKPYPLPIGFVAGTDSQELRQAGMDATRKLVGDNLVMIEGTHLYTMESPRLTAQLTREMIHRLLPELAAGDRRQAFA